MGIKQRQIKPNFPLAPKQTQPKRRWTEVSIWATAHLSLPWLKINPNLLLVDSCW